MHGASYRPFRRRPKDKSIPHRLGRGGARFPFRLVSRRIPNVYNASAHDLPALHRKRRYNPAFLHPADLEAVGVAPGEVVEIRSNHDSVLAVVEAAPELRRGGVSMAHRSGGVPERDAELFEIGSNTSRLISVERECDPYSGIPRMSGIPASIERWEGPLASLPPSPETAAKPSA